MITVGFFVFWFAIGALFAMLTSFITDNLLIQTTVFLISSSILLFFTKPLVDKYIKKDTIPTNAFSIIGKRGIVTKDIIPNMGVGQIKVEGEIWSAKSKDEIKLTEGTEVEIVNIDGVKAIVKS